MNTTALRRIPQDWRMTGDLYDHLLLKQKANLADPSGMSLVTVGT